MLKRRLIPVLFLKDGWIVRSENFTIHSVIGDPKIHIDRLVSWDVDEVIIVNISSKFDGMAHQRSDYKNKPTSDIMSLIRKLAIECRTPLSFGGGIRCLTDAAELVSNGADKVILNNLYYQSPKEVEKIAKTLGSQAVVLSVDYRYVEKTPTVFIENASVNTQITPCDWIKQAEDYGVGEIFLNCADKDGAGTGYDIDLIADVVKKTTQPVIACGGAGSIPDFHTVFEKTTVEAVAAGNIFHFSENCYPRAKKFLKLSDLNVR